MESANKKHMMIGTILFVSFFIILFYMFTLNFGKKADGAGMNAFEASDDLFNKISKGSSYYIGELKETNKKFDANQIDVALPLGKLTANEAVLLQKAGMTVSVTDKAINAKGTLGQLTAAALADADVLYTNDKDKILEPKYGMPARAVGYAWHKIINAGIKALNDQRKFAEAKWLNDVKLKAVEVSYNYFGIPPEKAIERWGILLFSLVFYVIYTLWYGYAWYEISNGLGLKMKGGKKKEA